MLYIKQSVSDITFENLTLTAGDMNGVKPDDFSNSGSIGDGRLAVRAGDADHRTPELRPVIGRQPLKGLTPPPPWNFLIACAIYYLGYNKKGAYIKSVHSF